MARSYLVLDIETVPDPALYVVPEVAPGPPSPGAERPFPPLYVHRPIVLGVLWLDEDYRFRRLGVIGEGKDEAGKGQFGEVWLVTAREEHDPALTPFRQKKVHVHSLPGEGGGPGIRAWTGQEPRASLQTPGA